MSQDDDETSEGGSKILRHGAEVRAEGVAEMDGEALEAIDRHLRTYIGEPANVFHELVSDIVHIDVHIIAPSEEGDCYTLVTTGMSDRPMTTPAGAEALRYAELMLALPGDWTKGPLWEASFDNEALYWPIRLLKTLARLPHIYETWLGVGHTIPNGDPPKPYAKNTELCCALIMPPIAMAPEVGVLKVRPDKTIHFYSVIPLYESEMKLKLAKGADTLIECLFEASVTELLDPKRPLAGKKKKKFIFF